MKWSQVVESRKNVFTDNIQERLVKFELTGFFPVGRESSCVGVLQTNLAQDLILI